MRRSNRRRDSTRRHRLESLSSCPPPRPPRTCVAPLSVCPILLHPRPPVLNSSFRSRTVSSHDDTLLRLPVALATILSCHPPRLSFQVTIQPCRCLKKKTMSRAGSRTTSARTPAAFPFSSTTGSASFSALQECVQHHFMSVSCLIFPLVGRLLPRCLRPLHHQRECFHSPRVRRTTHATTRIARSDDAPVPSLRRATHPLRPPRLPQGLRQYRFRRWPVLLRLRRRLLRAQGRL